MAFSLSYYDVVKTDIIEAKDWYKTKEWAWKKTLLLKLKNCIHRLQNNPLNYEIKYKNVRTAFTAIFSIRYIFI